MPRVMVCAGTGIYLGTTARGVYASPDEGESWSGLPAGLPRIQGAVAVPA
jgi:hypothetical protein